MKTGAAVNENENAKLIRQLTMEVAALVEQLTSAKIITTAAMVTTASATSIHHSSSTDIEEILNDGEGVINSSSCHGNNNKQNNGSRSRIIDSQQQHNYMQLKQRLQENEQLLLSISKSYGQQLSDTEQLQHSRVVQAGSKSSSRQNSKHSFDDRSQHSELLLSTAHMVNLHRDRQMSQCLFYWFRKGMSVRVCQREAIPAPGEHDIVVFGLQIAVEHAVITNNSDNTKITITPYVVPNSTNSSNASSTNDCDGFSNIARVFVNGVLITATTELLHNDRVMLGAHLVFKVVVPATINAAAVTAAEVVAADAQAVLAAAADEEFDWDYAQRERAESNMMRLLLATTTSAAAATAAAEASAASAASALKVSQLEAQLYADREQAKQEQDAKEKEYALQLSALEARLMAPKEEAQQQHLLERERQLLIEQHQKASNSSVEAANEKHMQLEQQLAAQQHVFDDLRDQQTMQGKQQAQLESVLLSLIPMVNEANAISVELEKPVRFTIRMQLKKSVVAQQQLQIQHQHTDTTEILIRAETTYSSSSLLHSDNFEVTWSVDYFISELYEMRAWYEYYLITKLKTMPIECNSNKSSNSDSNNDDKNQQDECNLAISRQKSINFIGGSDPFNLHYYRSESSSDNSSSNNGNSNEAPKTAIELLGTCRVFLKPLAYLLPIAETVSLINYR